MSNQFEEIVRHEHTPGNGNDKAIIQDFQDSALSFLILDHFLDPPRVEGGASALSQASLWSTSLNVSDP